MNASPDSRSRRPQPSGRITRNLTCMVSDQKKIRTKAHGSGWLGSSQKTSEQLSTHATISYEQTSRIPLPLYKRKQIPRTSATALKGPEYQSNRHFDNPRPTYCHRRLNRHDILLRAENCLRLRDEGEKDVLWNERVFL